MKEPAFSAEYFYDEVREGFYVREMMKRSWAAQLRVLYEIACICERHSIRWYADMGTLIGAVRHKGFVPWDDDIDISMNRDDWEEFFRYAKDELPEGYCVLAPRMNPEYTRSIGRITNSHSINTGKEHMETFFGCPYVIGVDVFPIDRIYRDPEKEQDRKARGKAIRSAFKCMSEEGMQSPNLKKILAGIERDNHTTIHRKGNLEKELVLLFERICMECRDEDYEEVALMNTWILEDWANCPRKLYEDQIEVSFEGYHLMAPAHYDELLTIYYHDYMTVKKDGGAHNYPYYQDQEEIFRKKIGHNPYRYTYTPSDLQIQRGEKNFREKCYEIMGLISKAAEQIAGIPEEEARFQLLSGCQEIAVTLGTMLEDKYGEGCEGITELEGLCELFFLALEEWEPQFPEKINATIGQIEAKIERHLQTEKEIVFLLCRKAWWDTMEPLYDKISEEGDIKVRVMPVSYYDCDPYGEIGEQHDESENFMGVSGYTDPGTYDIVRRHPEIIVMQVPFDEYSGAMTVPEQYYSRNLLKACDELWYLPCFAPDPPGSSDEKAAKSISFLIEQPAVFYADKVILHNDKMREFYIETLTGLTGEGQRDYWENRTDTLANVLA